MERTTRPKTAVTNTRSPNCKAMGMRMGARGRRGSDQHGTDSQGIYAKGGGEEAERERRWKIA